MGVVDLGTDSVVFDKLADGNQSGWRADQCVIRLACRYLLGGGGADVEPDRGVEAEDLVDQGVLELVIEDLGVFLGGEVALLAPGLRVHADDAVYQLLEAPLAL